MRDFKVRCTACGAEFTTEEVESGSSPECANCQGKLEPCEPVKLACLHCSAEGEPGGIPFDELYQCEDCGNPLIIVSKDTDLPPPMGGPSPEKTIVSTTQNSGKPADSVKTIALLKKNHTSSDDSITLAKPPSAPAPGNTDETIIAENLPPPDAARPKIRRGDLLDKKFGKFDILSEIARGGMGIVYKVHDPDLRRELALKVLLQGEGADENAIKRFMREARAAGNLNHPNIIAVHEMGQIDGQYFFTMDLIEGWSLQELMEGKNGRHIDVDDFIAKIHDVCLALQAAHDKNIVHRDLKPANIMIREKDNSVVLMDFGLAKDSSSMTMVSMTGTVLGSPAYMSPEQAQGKIHDIDHRSDIYSLGIVLYEGLTGTQPFSGETIFDTLTKVVQQEPVPLRQIAPNIPHDLQNIVLKCMEKDPDKRYASMLELASDLDAYLSGGKVSARSIIFYTRLWRRIRRKPAAMAALISVPLVIAAAIAGWLVFSRPSYVDIAEQTMKSADNDRRFTALKELSAQLFENKIGNAEEKNRALALIRDRVSMSEKPEIAEAAAKSSAKLLDGNALPNLVKLADDPSAPESLRLTSLEALAAIAEKKSFPGINAPLCLAKLAKHEKNPLQIRIKAAEGLQKAWAPDQIPAMMELANDADLPPELRVTALRALSGRIPFESPRMSEIIQLYADPVESVAKAASECLKSSRKADSLTDFYGIKGAVASAAAATGRIVKMNADRQKQMMEMIDDGVENADKKKSSQLNAMLAKLNGENPEDRLAAAYDLGQFGDGKAVPELAKHLTDPESRVRGVAARSIVQLSKSAKPNMAEIRKLVSNDDMLVREAAILIIGELNDKESLQPLLKAADKEQSRRVALNMAKAFQRFGDKSCIPALGRLLERYQENTDTASACIKALASFEKDVVPQLIAVLDSKNSKVQQEAIAELKEICGVDFDNDKTRWEQWAKENK